MPGSCRVYPSASRSRAAARTAAEIGVYAPESQWLIEGHGVDPDMVVDNLPHATFTGQDAQLEAAARHLLAEISKHPVELPRSPRYPDKSLRPR